MTELVAPELGVEARTGGEPDGDGALQVLLITEGGYPYQFSGVSTWCRLLVDGLRDVDYKVLAITGDPDGEPMFDLPPNVLDVTRVPLWGARESLESRRDLGLSDLRRARRTVDGTAVADLLVPAFGSFVDALLAETADPVGLADTVTALYAAFLYTDFDSAMRHRAAWDAFVTSARAAFPPAAARAGYPDAPLQFSDLVTGMHWITHWLLPLARPLPAVDVAHATMAGSCTLPAVALKMHHGSRFVFSEHGVYLREAYLREASGRGSLFLKLLTLGFARRTTELAYALADAVSTCCDYNTRWQARTGAPRARVATVHYGLDAVTYGLDPGTSARSPGARMDSPVVVWMGRIDPIKDLGTLLRAAAVVRDARPDIRFRLYGTPPVGGEAYLDQMIELRDSLGLDGIVDFAGYASDPMSAYADADVVVLTSVSEGFPFSTLEAMACGRPVVATSVGGIGEQLGNTGILVEPRDHAGLAASLLDLFADPARAEEMGEAARRRVRTLFDLGAQNDRILELYADGGVAHEQPAGSAPRVMALDPDAPSADDPVVEAVVDPAGDAAGEAAGEAAVADLVRTVAATVPHPVDALEVATVIEANGVSDAVARVRYGAHDVFALGEELLTRLRAERAPVRLRPHDVEPPSPSPQRVPEIGRGLLLLLPAAAVVLIAHVLSALPGWTPGTGRALMVGVTISMVVSNAAVFGVVRRSSLLIGCGRWTGARRFLWRATWVSAIVLLAGETIGISVAALAWGVPGPELVTFALSFSGLSLFWIASSGFAVLHRSFEPGVAVLVGLGVGVLVDRVLRTGSSRHLEIALLVGYLAALAFVGARARALLGRERGGPDGYRPPRATYVVEEALPYATYGGLLIALVLGPNLLTAFVGRSSTVSAGDLSSVQVGMTLALLPLMVSLFAVDDAVQRFWGAMCRALSATDPDSLASFGADQRRLQAARRFRILGQVAAISALCVPAAWFLAGTRAFGDLGVSSRSYFVTAFVTSLVAYLLLGSALVDSVTMLTLSWSRSVVRALAAGVLVAAVVAASTFPVGYPEVGLVAMVAGTATFAVAAAVAGRRFAGELPYHLVRSM